MGGDAIVSLLLAVLIFLAITLLGWGLFGRPDQSLPRCTRCRRDARPFAWNDPIVCACGAPLDRAGAVRTRGRLRRPRVASIGLVLLMCAGTATAVQLDGAGRGLMLVDALPFWTVKWATRQGYSWGWKSAARRVEADTLSSSELADLAFALPPPPLNKNAPINRMELEFLPTGHSYLPSMVRRWAAGANPARADELLCFLAGITIDPAGPEDESDVRIRLDPRCSAWLVRINAVRCAGRELAFQVVPLLDEQRVGPRTMDASADLVLVIPPDLDRTGAMVTIDCALAMTSVAHALVEDAHVHTEPDPSRWRVSLQSTHIVRTIPLAAKAGVSP